MQKSALSPNPTLYLLSLGCPKNRVDSEVMLGTLLEQGYEVVEDPREAEVVVINSCAFIGEAKQESIDAILEHARLKETARCKALVVAGCLTQRYADVLQHEMPEVDYFVGTSAYPRIAEIIRGERDRAVIPDPDYIADARTPRRNSMPKWTAYVKVSEGCDNQCTFCIIPTLRGAQRSRPVADIVTILMEMQGARNIDADGDRVTLEFGSAREDAAELLARLVAQKVPVASFTPHAPGLEEAYLRTEVAQVD